MKKQLITLLLAASMLLSGCVYIHPNDIDSETEEMTSQETVEQPAPESTLNESTLNESRGLAFRSAENNTCYVMSIGTCKDSILVIPATSPKGETVVGVSEKAFRNCSTLKIVYLPDTVKSIGDYAFEFCTSLERIHLPENLETIGEGAFSYCSSLKHLEIPEQVNFPNGTRNLFRGCVKLEGVKLPENIEQIGIYCFLRCYSLESFVISSRVTEIGEFAFSGCESLNSLTVEEGNQIFISKDGCVIDPSTKTLVAIAANAEIPTDGSVEILADGLFAFLNRDYMAIPEGVKKLGRELFDGARELESVSIPHSAEDFSEDTFSFAWGLKTIYYNGTVDEWKQLIPNDSWMTWTEKLTIQCTDGEVYIYCDDPAIG